MSSFNDTVIENFRANNGVWRAYWPDAAEYETRTDRKFPVAVITVR